MNTNINAALNAALAPDDRRDSMRFPLQMHVRSYDAPRFVMCEGDLSLGGAKVRLPARPSDTQVEVLVNLQGNDLRLQGEIIDVVPQGAAFVARVKFGELLLEDELAIARFLDDVSGEWDLWKPEEV